MCDMMYKLYKSAIQHSAVSTINIVEWRFSNIGEQQWISWPKQKQETKASTDDYTQLYNCIATATATATANGIGIG